MSWKSDLKALDFVSGIAVLAVPTLWCCTEALSVVRSSVTWACCSTFSFWAVPSSSLRFSSSAWFSSIVFLKLSISTCCLCSVRSIFCWMAATSLFFWLICHCKLCWNSNHETFNKTVLKCLHVTIRWVGHEKLTGIKSVKQCYIMIKQAVCKYCIPIHFP